MAYSGWNGIANKIYVLDTIKGEIVKVCDNYRQGVEFIDSKPITERYDFGNATRYALAKIGLYPRTKKGDSDLENAISNLTV